MRSVRFVLASALALGAGPAVAADMVRRPVITDETMIPQEVGTGWYLRGDVGYAYRTTPDVSRGGSDFANLTTSKEGFSGFGGGFGYKFNDWFRADATLDVVGRYQIRGTGVCSMWSTADCTVDPTLSTRERTSARAVAGLVNAYVDLGDWAGLTPYVGAGVGLARVTVLGHNSTTDGSSSPDRSFGKGDKYTLAASLSAGASYALGDGLLLDIGYRYLWIDGGQSGGDKLGGESGSVSVKNFSQHQVRAGLRYYLY